MVYHCTGPVLHAAQFRRSRAQPSSPQHADTFANDYVALSQVPDTQPACHLRTQGAARLPSDWKLQQGLEIPSHIQALARLSLQRPSTRWAMKWAALHSSPCCAAVYLYLFGTQLTRTYSILREREVKVVDRSLHNEQKHSRAIDCANIAWARYSLPWAWRLGRPAVFIAIGNY